MIWGWLRSKLYVTIKAAIKSNKNKRVAKRLEVLELRYAMKSNVEIAKKTGFNERYITTLIQTYKKHGLAENIRIKQTMDIIHALDGS